jgi:hypothetical protein
MITTKQLFAITDELMKRAKEARQLAGDTPGNMGFVYCGKIDGLVDACGLLNKLISDEITRPDYFATSAGVPQ